MILEKLFKKLKYNNSKMGLPYKEEASTKIPYIIDETQKNDLVDKLNYLKISTNLSADATSRFTTLFK